MLKITLFALQCVILQCSFAQVRDTFRTMPLILKGSAATWMNMGRGEVKVIVPAEHTNGAWSLLKRKETPGFQTDLHKHSKMDEAFYVLEGELTVFLNDIRAFAI